MNFTLFLSILSEKRSILDTPEASTSGGSSIQAFSCLPQIWHPFGVKLGVFFPGMLLDYYYSLMFTKKTYCFYVFKLDVNCSILHFVAGFC